MKPDNTEAVEVFLVEDNPADAQLIRETFSEYGPGINLRIAKDGYEALKMLLGQEGYERLPTPSLILFDLNLPKNDALEFLSGAGILVAEAGIPIIFLTTSDAEHDLVKTYNVPVASSLTKPIQIDEFRNMIRSIKRDWLE